MPVKKIISDAAWLTSGAATAANTGFAFLDAATFGVDENGEKFLACPTNTATRVRIDETTDFFSGGQTEYISELIVYLEHTGASGSNLIGTPGVFSVDLDAGAGGRGIFSFAAANNLNSTGLNMSLGVFTGATVNGAMAGMSREPIPINRKFSYGVFAHRTQGIWGVCINGVRVASFLGTAPPTTWPAFHYSLSAIPGARWRIYSTAARPCISRYGTDFEFTPQDSFYASSSDHLVKSFVHTATDTVAHGKFWGYTGAVTASKYATGGIAPERTKCTAGVGGVTAKTRVSIGTVQYNEYGDMALVFCLYVPTGDTLSFTLRNAADTADALKLQVASAQLQNAAGAQLTASDGTLVPVLVDRRYFLVVNLSRGGSASFTLMNATDLPTSRLVYSNAIAGGWTPQELGPIVVTATEGVEFDRVDYARWWMNQICDSLSAAFASTTTPNLVSTANNLGVYLPHTDTLSVPGICHIGSRQRFPRGASYATSARSGYRRSHLATYSRAYMTHTHAMELFVLDGGHFNDVTNGTTAAQMMEFVEADLAFCDATRNRLVLTPPHDRPLGVGSGMTSANAIEMRKFRTLQEQFVRDNASNPRLFYCDTTRVYQLPMTTTDGVHPSAEADQIGRGMLSTYMSARQFAALNPSVTGAAGSGLSAGQITLTTGSGMVV